MNIDAAPMGTKVNKPTANQLTAWVLWVGFLLFSVAAWLFERAETHDPYFIAHYQNNPMNGLTVFMTSNPVWMAVLPFLWLPFVIRYQRQNHPEWTTLLFLSATMFMVCVVVTVLMFCSGPPIQM